MSNIGSRKYDTQVVPEQVAENYKNLVYKLLGAKFTYHDEKELCLHFDAKAYGEFVDYYNNFIEPHLVTDMAFCKDWGGKYHGELLRLCGIIHCIKCALNDIEPVESRVTLDTFCNAIEIGEYFREQAIYAYSLGDVDIGTIKAERVLNKLRSSIFSRSDRTIFTSCADAHCSRTPPTLLRQWRCWRNTTTSAVRPFRSERKQQEWNHGFYQSQYLNNRHYRHFRGRDFSIVLKMQIVHKTTNTNRRKKEVYHNDYNTEKEIVDNILELLIQLTEDGENSVPQSAKASTADKVEMLTIKESAALISGLSEHTVRQLVRQGKVKSVRTGAGKNGKILVNKADLIAYFNGEGV